MTCICIHSIKRKFRELLFENASLTSQMKLQQGDILCKQKLVSTSFLDLNDTLFWLRFTLKFYET